MPTISVKMIRRPRTQRRCEMCGNGMAPPHVRMFGSAHDCEKPYTIYVCEDCGRRASDPKVVAAMSRSDA